MTDLHALVKRSPLTRTVPGSSPVQLCGKGIPQPGWSACLFPGAWLIRGYQHHYCTGHAAVRLRAIRTADEMHRQAEAERARKGLPR